MDTTFDQSATITEDDANDTGTFQFSVSGVTLQGTDTASVTVTINGSSTTENGAGEDFTAAVIAAIVAQSGTIATSDETATSVILTWDAGDPLSFTVDLTSVDDAFPDSPETLTLDLGSPTINAGADATVEVAPGMGSADLTITDTD